MTETSIDWGELFHDVETLGKVPKCTRRDVSRARAVFMDMVLDLGDIKRAVADSGYAPPIIQVYADVLTVPDGLTWLLPGTALFIATRILQGGRGATIGFDGRGAQGGRLVVFTNQVQGRLGITARLADGHESRELDKAPAQGVSFALQDGRLVEQDVSWSQGLPLQAEGLMDQYLSNEFIFPSLLAGTRPEIARDMFCWVKDWASATPDLQPTFFRSSAMIALLGGRIDAAGNAAAFVPYLSAQIYVDLAHAYVEEAAQYERDYFTLAAVETLTEQNIALANTMCDLKLQESEFASKVLSQAQANFDNAQRAVETAGRNFALAQDAVMNAQVDFQERGVPQWRRDKVLDAVISLSTALVTFAVGVGGMLVGDEAAGAAAVQGAVKGVGSVEEAARTGSEIARLAKDLKDVMGSLKKTAEALSKVYEFGKVAATAARDIRNAGRYADTMQSMDMVTDDVSLSATTAWQVYQLNADAVLAGPVDEGIEFATELKLAVDSAAVYGQALAAAQLAAIQAGQTYADAVWKKQLADQQQKRLEQQVADLQAGAAPTAAMMQLFYQRLLDARSGLVAAIEGYRDSFFYWALTPSTVRPDLLQSADQLGTGIRTLTNIVMDRSSALERFSPPPQRLSSKRVVITDPATLATLRDQRKVTYAVPISEETFQDGDRVRLTCVRAWLEGARPTRSDRVTVVMRTAGSYADRFEDTAFQFTSKPLLRAFEYRISRRKEGSPGWRFPDGSYGYIEIDGRVDTEVSYAYFEPTPFAQWEIQVSPTSDVDLSGVTRITLEFEGSLIPRITAVRASMQPMVAEA